VGRVKSKGLNKGASVLAVVGMACYWPMFRNNYFGLLFSPARSGSQYSETLFLTMLIGVAALALVTALCHTKVALMLTEQRRPVLAVSIAASLIVAVQSMTGLNVLALDIGMTVVLVFYQVFITLAWGIFLGSSTASNTGLISAISFSISFIVSTTTLLPQPLNYALVVFCPLLCGLCLFLMPHGEAVSSLRKDSSIGFKDPLFILVLILVLSLMLGSIIRGVFSMGVLDYGTAPVGGLRQALSIILSLSLVVALVLSKRIEGIFSIIWLLFMLLFFVGLFAVAGFSDDWRPAGGEVIIMSRTFLGFFLWVTLLRVSQAKRMPVAPLLSLCFLLTEACSGLLSNMVVPLVFSADTTLDPAFLTALSLVMALVLLASSFIYFAVQVSQIGTFSYKALELPESLPADDEVPLVNQTLNREKICADLARQHGLTKREQEILVLLSGGHSVKRIAEILVITPATVQTHCKSVYSKMEIHTRQAIIDRIESCRSV
jgi:DNA-binding CsgD family transcriptional regulator